MILRVCRLWASRPRLALLSFGTRILLVFVLVFSSNCDVELYHDLSERRANEAILALRESGLRVEKRVQQRGGAGRAATFGLVVPRSEEVRALRVLEQRGLPRLSEPAAAPSARLLFSPLASQSENAAALAAEIATTLERLPEVAEARVHLALPEPEPLSPLGTPRPTASVLLKLRAPPSVRPSELAELVARAVPGLDAPDVTVVRVAPTPPAATGMPAALSKPILAIGPLLLMPESRGLALFLGGLVVLLTLFCAVLLRLAWPRKSAYLAAKTPTL